MTAVANTSKQKNVPTWKGTVVSNRMQNTVVVAVETLKTHPKYKKQYQATKRYKVETEGKEYALGAVVTFRECRPISKGKHHIVTPE
ncbi:MAG: 30S ribosomal protein S17 [Candidatus Moraniibacteriota bacterium]|nr:MAG: 30S ribosomal protein S17 [Candidatus Moranbacteria bacterium]